MAGGFRPKVGILYKDQKIKSQYCKSSGYVGDNNKPLGREYLKMVSN